METKTVYLRIAHGLEGLRLDKAVAEHPDIVSRSQATKLIQDGLVTLNGKPAKPSQKTVFGETYEITIPVEEPTELLPFELALDICYEDDDVIVINKPSGLVVHPSAGHAQDSLVNALVHHNIQLSNGSESKRPGVVHRLDKDTSGLIVVAKNDFSHANLCEQFRKKTVHRIYWALVYDAFSQQQGTITSYLKRHPTDRKRYASEKLKNYEDPTGKKAITHFQVQKQHETGITLVKCQLETGRTHQIRVHMSESRHPILGDQLYGSNGRLKNLKSLELKKLISNMNRIGLHAAELGFVHPKTNEQLYFSVIWPQDIQELINHLKFNHVEAGKIK